MVTKAVMSIMSKPEQVMLTSKTSKPEKTRIPVGDCAFGGDKLVIIAGPCAVENPEEYIEMAVKIKQLGAHVLRGCIYKPRTSPYSFQGMGDSGLDLLRHVKKTVNIPIITEAMEISQLEKLAPVVDVIQIGTRNMQNFDLLKAAGQLSKPILLKRGMSSTIKEWLLAAEYIMAEGNMQVILCERGIRTFETATRNTLDLSVIPLLRSMTHLPIVIDPSHATGVRALVAPMAKAAAFMGADGLLVEVHQSPETALCDGEQSLHIPEFKQLINELEPITQLYNNK